MGTASRGVALLYNGCRPFTRWLSYILLLLLARFCNLRCDGFESAWAQLRAESLPSVTVVFVIYSVEKICLKEFYNLESLATKILRELSAEDAMVGTYRGAQLTMLGTGF